MVRGKIEKRGASRRKIKPIILIVTEGTQTEPRYFEHFRTRQTNIDIQVVGNKTAGSKTDYANLVRKAIDYRNRYQLSLTHGDSIWVVVDGDVQLNNPDALQTKNDQLAEARKIAGKAGVELILSNPCIEFWFLLHFKFTTGYLKDYDAVATALREFVAGYEKTIDVADLLTSHLSEAVHNAERVESYHKDNGEITPFGVDVNPFSDVYKLIKQCM